MGGGEEAIQVEKMIGMNGTNHVLRASEKARRSAGREGDGHEGKVYNDVTVADSWGQKCGEGGPMKFSVFHCKHSIRYPGSGALVCIYKTLRPTNGAFAYQVRASW